MKKQQIFRNYREGSDPWRMKLFLSYDGKIVRINHQFLNNEDFEMMARKVVWGDTRSKEWIPEDLSEEDVRRALKEIALGNPIDFKMLYYTLKEKNSEAFSLIKSVLKEVQSEFNFE